MIATIYLGKSIRNFSKACPPKQMKSTLAVTHTPEHINCEITVFLLHRKKIIAIPYKKVAAKEMPNKFIKSAPLTLTSCIINIAILFNAKLIILKYNILTDDNSCRLYLQTIFIS